MDDMVFQNNNKNAIYVLNTSYNTYGEFGRPNAFGYQQISTDEEYNNPKTYSLSRSLHKLKSLRHHSGETILGNGGVGSTTMESYSSSMTSCSPAASALQKLFNCSSTSDSCRNINYNNNNNCHIHHDMSHHGISNESHNHNHYSHQETGNQHNALHPQLEYHHLESLSLHDTGNGNTTSGSSCVLPCVGYSGKKKHFNATTSSVKSTLIAKKTKFWKYLVEEEKWRKHSDENLSTNNCERDGERFIGKLLPSNHSSINENHTTNNSPRKNKNTHPGPGALSNHFTKNNSNNFTGNSISNSNWNGNSDTNKYNSNNQKSSAELYKEAAQILGLSCTLCDNCRCLDCQSRYFECDDSDSYSEFSLMDEYFESLPDVNKNLRELNYRHFSPQSLHDSHQGEVVSVSENQPTNAEMKNSVHESKEGVDYLSVRN